MSNKSEPTEVETQIKYAASEHARQISEFFNEVRRNAIAINPHPGRQEKK